MLKQRIITALIMLAVLLSAIFYPDPRAFALVSIALIAAAAWEWARLNELQGAGAVVLGGVCAALCGASWIQGAMQGVSPMLWTLAGAAWVLLGAWLLHSGAGAWRSVPQLLRLIGGVLALWLAWLALMKARLLGINFLFSVMALVWVADIAAYFSGRALGGRFFKRKLAPSISPGKTWEGVAGGVVGVIVCALVWRHLDGVWLAESLSFYSRLSAKGFFFLLLTVCFMCAMSVVGDLVESLFKRSAGVKDSSALLPGHGGVLDRVDALLPTLPLAMMLVSL